MTDTNKEEDNSASNLRLIGFNANSIGRNPKRSKVFHFLRKHNPNILIIYDTRLSKDIENAVKAEWGGQAFFSSYDSQSRGVAIFIKKDLPIKILDKFNDQHGNILAILVEFESRRILLEGVYGPNHDYPEFYDLEVFNKTRTYLRDATIKNECLKSHNSM